MTTYNGLMSDQVFAGFQSARDDVRDAVAVAFHVRRGGPFLTIYETLLIDGEPLERVQIREYCAVVARTGSHIDSQRPTVVRPRGVPAGADSAASVDGSVRGGGRSGIVANGLCCAGAPVDWLIGAPLALDHGRSGVDPRICAPLDACTAPGRRLVAAEIQMGKNVGRGCRWGGGRTDRIQGRFAH